MPKETTEMRVLDLREIEGIVEKMMQSLEVLESARLKQEAAVFELLEPGKDVTERETALADAFTQLALCAEGTICFWALFCCQLGTLVGLTDEQHAKEHVPVLLKYVQQSVEKATRYKAMKNVSKETMH